MCWVLTQSGSYAQEHQVPLAYIHCSVMNRLLEEELLREVPKGNKYLIEAAYDFQKQHDEEEGIYGMANTMKLRFPSQV